MLPETLIEALHFFDRSALEGMQIHSRYLRDLVNAHARTLPLRLIHEVRASSGNLYIQLLDGGVRASEHDLDTLFHRMNNAFVRRLSFSFHADDAAFLYYLRANADDLQCQVGALRVLASSSVEIDHVLVDFVGVHLKPRVYEAWARGELPQGYAMLFTHYALRANVGRVVYELLGSEGDSYPAPVCIIPEMFGVGAMRSCAIATDVDPRPWIAKFVEMFKKTPRETNVVQSVTLLHKRFYDDVPLRVAFPEAVDPFGRPRCAVCPTPHNAFIKEQAREAHRFIGRTTTRESTFASLFVFENAESAKNLEIRVWTVEQQSSLHYAYMLTVLDI